jgi:hypothetical protein
MTVPKHGVNASYWVVVATIALGAMRGHGSDGGSLLSQQAPPDTIASAEELDSQDEEKPDSVSAAFPEARPLESNDPAIWRTTNRCGVNAVYVFLGLHNKKASYNDLLKHIPIDQTGTNLRDMQRELERHGLPTRVVRTTPDTLPRLLPAIIHRETEVGTTGHYDVVTSADDQTLEFVEGTGGGLARMTFSDLHKSWTGFALVGVDKLNGRSAAPLVAWSILIAMWLFVFYRLIAYLART